VRNIFTKIVFGLTLLSISSPSLIARSEEKILVSKDQKTIYQDKLSEFPPVHEIHKGGKMEPDKKDSDSALKCRYCHVGDLSTPVKENLSMSLCLECHTRKSAPKLTCVNCHQGTVKIFNGVEGMGVKVIESNMIDLDCNDCHNSDPQNRIPPNLCEDCHEESYNEKMTQMQAEYTRKLTTMKRRYNIIKNYIRVFQREQNMSSDKEKIKTVAHNYKLALMDGSKGVHNNEFILEVLNEVQENSSKIREYYKPNINNLFQDIQSNDLNTRLKAVEMLGEIGDKKAEKYLKRALDDPDRNVRINAKIALIKIKAQSKLKVKK
jgi:ribosomal protein S8